MGRGQAPDPRKRKNTHPHATYLKVGNGCKEPGYMAGPVFGCYGHRTSAHKPCVELITQGELTCALCAAGWEAEWRGYVGIWDRDWTLRYALIGEDYYPSVDAIPHREQVVCSRGKNAISPLVIRTEKLLTREIPNRSPWDVEIDMLEICLSLWKDGPLAAWFTKQKTLKPAKTEDEPKLPNGKPFSPMYKAAAKRYSGPPKEAPVGDALNGALSRVKARESMNGDGKAHAPPKG